MIRLIIRFSLAALLTLGLNFESSAAQYYYFTRYTSKEGLPNNTIACCIQDSRGFIWIGTKDGIYRFDGYDFIAPEDSGEDILLGGMVGSICEGKDGEIWFSTAFGVGHYNPETGKTTKIEALNGIMCYDADIDASGNVWLVTSEGRFLKYNMDSESLTDHTVKSGIRAKKNAVDSNGRLWTITNDGDLLVYEESSDRFTSVPVITADGQKDVLGILEPAGDDRLLISTESGRLLLFSTVSNKAEVVFRKESAGVGNMTIRAILARAENEYWIGTANGLYIIRDGDTIQSLHDNSDNHSLTGDDLWCLAKDSEGNVWLGTFYNGLNLWQNKQDIFQIIYENPSGNSIEGHIVRPICSDEKGGIWIGTEDGGLNNYNVSTHVMRNIRIRNSHGSKLNIQDLLKDGDDLWIATFDNGIYVLDSETETIKKHFDSQFRGCVSLQMTGEGKILAGTLAGLYEYDKASGIFTFNSGVGVCFVHDLLEDSNGNQWVGIYGHGLKFIDKDGNVHSISTKDHGYGLTSDYVTALFEDSHHRLWVCTEGGGLLYTTIDGTTSGNFRFKSISRRDGLTSNIVSSVTEDLDGRLWVASARGLMQIDTESLDVKEVFFGNNDIIGNQYSYNSNYISRNGVIYLGTTQGLFNFSPRKIQEAMADNPVYITEILANGADGSHTVTSEGRSTITSGTIKLKHKEVSSLSIKYAAPRYSIPHAILYGYSIQKGRKTTNSVTTSNTVSLSDITPGHYKFKVGIMGSRSKDSQKSIEFIVTPPLYRSAMAKIVYLLILAAVIYMAARSFMKRRAEARARQIDLMEHEKEKEIYNAKINFFTYITHEVRTPLTLIKMPLDKLIAKRDFTPSSEKDLMTMQANAERLLNLTNQIMDMRKMENNEVKLSYVKKDVCEIVRKVCASFGQVAGDQHITITKDIPESNIEMMCAGEVVEKIVGNLMSNAVKYCKDNIHVSLGKSEDGEIVTIKVDSNGDLIPVKESEKIFELFYQTSPKEEKIRTSKGTGLGLPYARNLATLHGGRLFLDTSRKDCKSFVLELPLNQSSQVEIGKNAGPMEENFDDLVGDYDSSRHYLLVVEDDPEMRSYIARELSEEYNVMTAANGQDALKAVESRRVDLVISDIMMPLMDGIQLCNAIKSRTELSHIPVLLLTAAIGNDTRMESLSVGADGYIEKPFTMDLLKANITSLFKNRELSFKQFTDSPLTHFNSVTVGNADQEFMDRLHEIVTTHMSDQDLNMEMLIDTLGTSKSTLYRKVKANTGLNINEYIRLCRLKEAAELLASQKYRINEVAYMVGFSSSSYFATSFQKQFNISPSTFVKNLKDHGTASVTEEEE